MVVVAVHPATGWACSEAIAASSGIWMRIAIVLAVSLSFGTPERQLSVAAGRGVGGRDGDVRRGHARGGDEGDERPYESGEGTDEGTVEAWRRDTDDDVDGGAAHA